MNSRRKGAAGKDNCEWLVTMRIDDFMKLYGDKQ